MCLQAGLPSHLTNIAAVVSDTHEWSGHQACAALEPPALLSNVPALLHRACLLLHLRVRSVNATSHLAYYTMRIIPVHRVCNYSKVAAQKGGAETSCFGPSGFNDIDGGFAFGYNADAFGPMSTMIASQRAMVSSHSLDMRVPTCPVSTVLSCAGRSCPHT